MKWFEVPLRALYRRVEESGRADLPLLSVYRDYGVIPREGREDNFNKPSDDLSRYKVVRPGDLVLNKMKTWQGSLGVSSYGGIVSPAYFTGRRVADADDRFMHHLLRSEPLIAEYGARSKGIRPSQWDLPWDEFASIKVRLPPVSIQRAIADFLDTETARIDALITKKRRMIDRLTEHRQAVTDVLLRSEKGVPLRRVADILPGYMFSSDDFAPHFDGPLLLRGVNVGVGALRWDDAVRLGQDRQVPARYFLRENDVVIGMDRPFVGGGTRVALIDEGSAGSLLVQRVCRVRVKSPAQALVVAAALGGPRFKAHVEADLTGVSVPHLSDEQIGSMRIPVGDATAVGALASRLLRVRNRTDRLTLRLDEQIELLRERRQALITVAVTGELDVPGMAA